MELAGGAALRHGGPGIAGLPRLRGPADLRRRSRSWGDARLHPPAPPRDRRAGALGVLHLRDRRPAATAVRTPRRAAGRRRAALGRAPRPPLQPTRLGP